MATPETAEEVVLPASLEDALLRVQEGAQELTLVRQSKGAERGSGRFDKYLAYPDLLREVRPLLSRNGLVWQTFPTTLDGESALRYRLTFTPAKTHVEDTMLLAVAKPTSQAQGSAITYARRYALMAVLELAPDDDDGQAASQPARPAPADPEKPMSDENVASMLEAIAERSLDVDKVFARVGITADAPILVGHGQQVKALLDAVDKKRAEATEPVS